MRFLDVFSKGVSVSSFLKRRADNALVNASVASADSCIWLAVGGEIQYPKTYVLEGSLLHTIKSY